MIRRLRGELAARAAGVVEVVTGDGVGYEVSVPLGLADRLPETGRAVELHTVLVVRDDAFELYGFGSTRERELFQRLRVPSGVGPRLALAILGALPADRIVRAIRGKDHRTLQTVSGVGRKTAERLVIELADKLDDLGAAEGDAAGAAGGAGGAAGAAIQALRALGYPRGSSETAVRRALAALDGRDVGAEELVRRALRHV